MGAIGCEGAMKAVGAEGVKVIDGAAIHILLDG